MALNFPLTMSFKIIAIAPQITVTDSQGNEVFYVRQKVLKLKEEVNVYSDNSQSNVLYTIKADRVIDISAKYNFADSSGNALGFVKRKGIRSIFRATYEISEGEGDAPDFTVEEESVMVRVADGCLNNIPIIGIFSGYLFNPTYLINDSAGNLALKLQKQPAFFESSFTIEKLGQVDDQDEVRIVLGLLMMTLLERTRG